MTDMELESKVNVPLLRKAVEWVEEQDALPRSTRQWDQRNWVVTEQDRLNVYEDAVEGCGTAYCLAGWIASQKYPELADRPMATINGEILHTEDVAERELGLPSSNSWIQPLFRGSNTAADIRRIAEELAGERL